MTKTISTAKLPTLHSDVVHPLDIMWPTSQGSNTNRLTTRARRP